MLRRTDNAGNRRIRCVLVCLAFVLAASDLFAADAAIHEEGLRPRYRSTERIDFRLVNPGEAAVDVAVAVERLLSGEWVEIAYSISKDDPPKGTILVALAPGAEEKVVWDAVELPVEPGTYRFRFDLFPPGFEKPGPVVHSHSFEIEAEEPRPSDLTSQRPR